MTTKKSGRKCQNFFEGKKEKRSDNIDLSNMKISLNMKNKNQFSIGNNIIKYRNKNASQVKSD